MESLRNLALLVGRILIAGVFIYDAMLLVRYQEANAAFMEKFGVPTLLLWPTAAFQFFGGILIVLGYFTRLAAPAFGAFCLLTALTFHRNFADNGEIVQFGKDAALAGGFLFLFAAGPGEWSADARRA